MDFADMEYDERLDWMRKRHAYFSDLVKGYNSLENFLKDKEEQLGILGMDLSYDYENQNRLTIYMSLDFQEYERYYIELDKDGKLKVSPIIMWQDPYCCNSELNIFEPIRPYDPYIIFKGIPEK